MIKEFILLCLSASTFASMIQEDCEEGQVQGQGQVQVYEYESDLLLKSMNSNQDIMNLNSVFDNVNYQTHQRNLVKSTNLREKKKDKKKKPRKESSTSSSDDEFDRKPSRSRRERLIITPPIQSQPPPQPNVSNPTPNDPIMHQQEVNSRNGRYVSREEDVGIINSAVRGLDGVLTVEGPIRRKPLIHS